MQAQLAAQAQPTGVLRPRPQSAAPSIGVGTGRMESGKVAAFSPQCVEAGAGSVDAGSRPIVAGVTADAASLLSRPSRDCLADRHQPPPGCFGVDPKEVYAAMLVRERQRIPIDQTNSYLQYRTIIVDWMCEVAEEFKLNPYAVQLSVHYFDLALQRVKVKKSQLQLVAMCCTLLAAKFYGPEERVPPIADLNACSKNTYDREKIVRMEVVILGALQWVTAELTPLHFVDHFLSLRAVQLADSIDGVPLYQSEKLDKIPRRLRQFAEFFVRLVLEDHSFYEFLPSLIGVAAIATSRYVLCLRPVWPDSLAAATGYDEADLRPCLQAILLYSSKRFPNKFVPIAGTTDTSASPLSTTPAAVRASPVASPVDTPSAQVDAPKPMSGEPKRQAWTAETMKNPRSAGIASGVAAAIESAATPGDYSTAA